MIYPGALVVVRAKDVVLWPWDWAGVGSEDLPRLSRDDMCLVLAKRPYGNAERRAHRILVLSSNNAVGWVIEGLEGESFRRVWG